MELDEANLRFQMLECLAEEGRPATKTMYDLETQFPHIDYPRLKSHVLRAHRSGHLDARPRNIGSFAGKTTVPGVISITPEGREFVRRWQQIRNFR